MENIKINTDFLRNLVEYPLVSQLDGEECNVQLGKCNNFSFRRGEFADGIVKYVEFHYGFGNLDMVMERYLGIERPVSTHYVIDRSGEVYNLVDAYYRAYGSGRGYFAPNSVFNPRVADFDLKNKNDMNSAVISITLVCNPEDAFTIEQEISSAKLLECLHDSALIPEDVVVTSWKDWRPSVQVGAEISKVLYNLAHASEVFDAHGVKHNFGFFISNNKIDAGDHGPIFSTENFNAEMSVEQKRIVDNLCKMGYKIDSNNYTEDTVYAISAFLFHFYGNKILDDANLKEMYDLYISNSSKSFDALLTLIDAFTKEYSYESGLCDLVENHFMNFDVLNKIGENYEHKADV